MGFAFDPLSGWVGEGCPSISSISHSQESESWPVGSWWPGGCDAGSFVPMRDLTTNKWGQWDLVWGHVKPFCVLGMST